MRRELGRREAALRDSATPPHFLRWLKDDRVLFAGAEAARRLLVEELGADFVPLYRTRELRPERPVDADLVVLASPSAARAFAALGVPMPAVSIGPETTAGAQRLGISVVAEAVTPDLGGLLDAVQSATR